MGLGRSMGILVTCAVLACGAPFARASDGSSACDAISPAHAHTLAGEAQRGGEYRRAAECYRLAGEPLQADRVQAKAFARTNAASTKQAAATLDQAKSQARLLRAAFRGQPAARERRGPG
jgi:hypothetical protein